MRCVTELQTLSVNTSLYSKTLCTPAAVLTVFTYLLYVWGAYLMLLSTLPNPFWRCMHRESYCNMYIKQQDAQILVNNLYFFVNRLYMFRTIINPSSGATLNKLCRHECTNCILQFIKSCSWWWTNDSPKHVEPINEKIKIIHKNLCISLLYIHIAQSIIIL